jgi:preprotein translocase subunit SecA
MANARDMVTRALRVGEGRKFKAYEKRTAKINGVEPEMELLDDEELRAEADTLRERARGGESLVTISCPRPSR